MRKVERNEVDPGSPNLVRSLDGLDASGRGRFKRKTEPPSVGDRFGQLVVTGYLVGAGNGIRAVVTQCDCGRPEHRVDVYALRGSRAVRCRACATEHATDTRQKKYLHYAGACPSVEHRRRLLNRISAIHTRCYSPGAKQWGLYGGRGIRVWWKDRYGDERMGEVSRSGRLQTLRWRYEMLAYLTTLNGWDKPDLELDRVDNWGDYAPGNLRFIDRRSNIGNRHTHTDLHARIADLEAENTRLRSLERGAS